MSYVITLEYICCINEKYIYMNPHYVVGIGEALWDVLPDGKKIGGAPANFAYHVSQFGIDSCVLSAVGQDELGDELTQHFLQKQLNCKIPTVGYSTGTVTVELDEKGVPQYDIKENVAWDNIPFTPELEALARRQGLCVSGHWHSEASCHAPLSGSLLTLCPGKKVCTEFLTSTSVRISILPKSSNHR